MARDEVDEIMKNAFLASSLETNFLPFANLGTRGGAKNKVTPPPGGAGRVQKSRSPHLPPQHQAAAGGGAKKNHDYASAFGSRE